MLTPYVARLSNKALSRALTLAGQTAAYQDLSPMPVPGALCDPKAGGPLAHFPRQGVTAA